MEQDPFLFLKLLGAIISICIAITGGAVYFLRKNTDRMIEANKAHATTVETNVNNALTNLGVQVDTKITSLHEQFTSFKTHVDKKFESVYEHIDKKYKEQSDTNYRQLQEVRGEIRDIKMTHEQSLERIHQAERELLQFKLEVSEKYQTKE